MIAKAEIGFPTRAYVTHITTHASLRRIDLDGMVRPRRELVITANTYSNDDLVEARTNFSLSKGVSVIDCVPFYLHAVQPMFLQLIVREVVRIDDLVFLRLPVSTLQSLQAHTFSTNPVYDAAVATSVSELWNSSPESGLHADWFDEQDCEPRRHRLMIERQAEVLIVGAVPRSLLRVKEAQQPRVSDHLVDLDEAARQGYRNAVERRPRF